MSDDAQARSGLVLEQVGPVALVLELQLLPSLVFRHRLAARSRQAPSRRQQCAIRKAWCILDAEGGSTIPKTQPKARQKLLWKVLSSSLALKTATTPQSASSRPPLSFQVPTYLSLSRPLASTLFPLLPLFPPPCTFPTFCLSPASLRRHLHSRDSTFPLSLLFLLLLKYFHHLHCELDTLTCSQPAATVHLLLTIATAFTHLQHPAYLSICPVDLDISSFTFSFASHLNRRNGSSSCCELAAH